jgi:TRAP-type C4-dicarboxylate transport system substrate-binding protein
MEDARHDHYPQTCSRWRARRPGSHRPTRRGAGRQGAEDLAPVSGRDRLCRVFARDLAKKTNGSLTCEVYPNSSLMKTNAQFSALRKGALDLSFYPMPYAGGEVPELNIGLMPALVTSYDQAAKWKTAPIGRRLTEIMEAKGIVMVSWVWQAGGVASRDRPLITPDDAKGAKVRGGSREMDMMFQKAGAAVLSLPSNESYAAMQTGAADAILTSSTSLISFRLEELAKHLTTGRGRSYWFMCEPLMMSKVVFDALTKDEKDAIMSVGAELDAFGFAGAKADDEKIVQVFTKAGAKTYDLDDSTIDKWRVLARETAWKDYAAKNASCAELMKMAEGMTS